jgi:hypothetical protein
MLVIRYLFSDENLQYILSGHQRIHARRSKRKSHEIIMLAYDQVYCQILSYAHHLKYCLFAIRIKANFLLLMKCISKEI